MSTAPPCQHVQALEAIADDQQRLSYMMEHTTHWREQHSQVSCTLARAAPARRSGVGQTLVAI